MANKRPKPEEIVSKFRQVEILMGQGMTRLDAIRQIGVVEQTYYRWKKKYGGMGADQLSIPEEKGATHRSKMGPMRLRFGACAFQIANACQGALAAGQF